MSYRRFLAIVALACGLLAAFGGSPYLTHHATLDIARAAAAVAHEEDHITGVTLAEWIRDRKAGLRVIDLRGASEFETYHLPTAERVNFESLPSTPFRNDETIVLLSDGGAHAAQGWVFLEALGYRHVYFLRGGVGEWLDEVMNPTIAADATAGARVAFERVSAVSRYFGGVPHVVDKHFDNQPSRGAAINPNRDHSSSEPPPDTTAKVREIRRRGC